jgi:hypothetical protein
VTANVTTGLGCVVLGRTQPSVTNNTRLLTKIPCGNAYPVNGVLMTAWKPGGYAGGDIIPTLTPSQAFVLYDPLAMPCDLTLK